MAIKKNAVAHGNFISEPGEYLVKITEIKTGMSKSGKPMLTVTFQTFDEKTIRGYFVKGLNFHMKALEEVKIAAGLKVTDLADALVGRSLGILVESQEPDTNGKVFMQIVGYGSAKAVEAPVMPTPEFQDDGIPF